MPTPRRRIKYRHDWRQNFVTQYTPMQLWLSETEKEFGSRKREVSERG